MEKYAIRFTLLKNADVGWTFGIEDGKVKTYTSKKEAQKIAAAFQKLFIKTHCYEVVKYEA